MNKMPTDLALCTCPDDEEYIDMEISYPPSKNTVEFEFQMSFSCNDQKTQDHNNNTSPADELFYKGKLLPLLLPPRQQMVENLASEITNTPLDEDRNYYSMPLVDEYYYYYSRNISPSESGRVEKNHVQDYYFSPFPDDLSRFVDNLPLKKTWSSVIGKKLKASGAYLKSLFNISVYGGNVSLSKGDAPLSKYCKKQHISTNSCPKTVTCTEDDNRNSDSRRSFSGAIKRHSPAKCLSSSSSSSSSDSSSSSSSSSFKSNGQYDLSLIRRSSSANEIEASIDAAIDHCKRSLKNFHEVKLGEDEKKDTTF